MGGELQKQYVARILFCDFLTNELSIIITYNSFSENRETVKCRPPSNKKTKLPLNIKDQLVTPFTKKGKQTKMLRPLLKRETGNGAPTQKQHQYLTRPPPTPLMKRENMAKSNVTPTLY